MLGFLKDKLKGAISRISKKVEDVPAEQVKEVIKESPVKKFPKKEKKPKKVKKVKEEINEKIEEIAVKEQPEEEFKQAELNEREVIEEPKEEKKGFFSRFKKKKEEVEEPKEEKKSFLGSIKEKVTTTKIDENKFNELFEDLEIALLENNVAFEVLDKIKEDLKQEIVDRPIKRGELENQIKNSLKESIEDLFLTPKIDLLKKIKEKKPYVICFVGVNGSGKTTTIAKVANMLKKNNLTIVMAAADTFRAAAIQQLKEWGNRLNTKVIAYDYGSDPAAVAFDAIKYAESHNLDVVLIDTAGRLHSNKDLVNEMKKIVKVAKPDLKLFIGESITGNDCVEQCKEFNEAVGIDGIILTKADVDEKGGTIISASYTTHRPIMFIGTGQELEDIKEFNKDEIIEKLGL